MSSSSILEPNIELQVKDEKIEYSAPAFVEADEMCRLCLFKIELQNSVNIFTNINTEQRFCDVVKIIGPVTIVEEDLLSKVICNLCATKLNEFWEFRKMIIYADTQQRQQIECDKILEEQEFNNIETSKMCKKTKENNEKYNNSSLSISEDSSDDIPDGSNDSIKCENNELTCGICGKKLKNKANFLRHCQTHEEPMECQYCDKKFSTKYQMNTHLKKVHFDGLLNCHYCEQTFKYQAALNSHIINIHNTNPTFKCDECGQEFRNKGTLKDHKNKHQNKKPYMCEICSKCFTGKDHLYHHKTSHQNDVLPCPNCGKTFRSKLRLRVHLRNHLGLKVVCEVCAKEFSSKQSLREHMKIHKGIKDCFCKVCGKSFTQSSVLARHMRVHSGERPYKCHLCEKDFPYAQPLRQHMNKYHPISEIENASSSLEYSNLSSNELSRISDSC